MKRENKYFLPFLDYYLEIIEKPKDQFIIEELLENTKFKTPDYLVSSLDKKTDWLFEIKQVIDRSDREKWARYGRYSRLQQNAINKVLPIDFTGEYMVELPIQYKITPRQAETIANDLVVAIQRHTDKFIALDKFELEVTKVSAKGRGIYLTTTSGGFIDPAKTIFENLHEKLRVANTQLAFKPKNKNVDKRILLLANQYEFSAPREIIRALSYCYEDLITLCNIQEIYYQWWSPDGVTASHLLAYSKSFIHRFENKSLTIEDASLFEAWFTSLELKDDEFKDKLFSGLKSIIGNEQPHHIFKDRYVREEMVRLGLWLIDQKRFSDVLWLINKFIEDTDPAEPNGYEGDPKFNYHEQIIKSEDPSIITGVRSHLAWVVHKLSPYQEFIGKAFEFTCKLLESDNLYVVQQAIVPLTEITARKKWLPDHYQRILKKLLFELLDKYGKYSGIAKYLVRAFYYLQDVGSDEALKIVTGLNDDRDLATVLIYYAVFRPDGYKNYPDPIVREYKAEPLRQELIRRITSQDKDQDRLKGTIAWNFWKIVKEEPEKFNKIVEFIDVFFEQPYSRSAYPQLVSIIEDSMAIAPDKSVVWFEQLLDRMIECAESESKSELSSKFWGEYPQIMKDVAIHSPERLCGIAKKIGILFNKGIDLYGSKDLLESYQYIQDRKLREEVKDCFKPVYANMAKQLKTPFEVNWDID